MTDPKRFASKERVLTALTRQIPDRTPIDYLSNPGIDGRLKKHFGLHDDDDEGLRQALGVDFRGVSAPYVGPRLHAEIPGRTVNPQWGIRTRWVENESGGYMDYCDFPLRDQDLEAIEKWPMPSPDDFNYDAVSAMCKDFEGYAVFTGGPGLGDIINSSGMLRSMEQVLVDLLVGEPALLRFVDRKIEVMTQVTERTLEAAKGRIDFLWMGEDLGTQRGPLISLDLFREQIRPRHQRYIDVAKSHDLPVMVHTCGSSSWAYEDFIEMGVDAVDTLQPEAKDMSPRHLKETFGGRLAFHGCISTAGPVAYGTPEQVVANVRETLEIMMPGGGYCLSPTHQLQDNSPTENVLAMYRAAAQYGVY